MSTRDGPRRRHVSKRLRTFEDRCEHELKGVPGTRRLNLDGTPAEQPTFTSSEPNWHVGDRVLIRPDVEYRIVAMEAAPEDLHGVWFVDPVSKSH